MVYPDKLAVFTCKLNPNVVGTWFVNDTDVNCQPEQMANCLPEEVINDINTTSVGLKETLTITARIQYNNTAVQFVPREITFKNSDNVNLIIQGIYIYMYVATYKNTAQYASSVQYLGIPFPCFLTFLSFHFE